MSGTTKTEYVIYDAENKLYLIDTFVYGYDREGKVLSFDFDINPGEACKGTRAHMKKQLDYIKDIGMDRFVCTAPKGYKRTDLANMEVRKLIITYHLEEK